MKFEVDLPEALRPPEGVRTRMLALPHGIGLSLREAGQPGQPLVVLLHGFPQAAFVWDELLPQIAAQGFHAVAPNLRGYERSSSPPDASAYRAKHLVQDVLALMQALSPNRPAHALIAHDWGGAVAWNLANQFPQAIQRLGIINSPHPGTLLRELKNSPAQQAASEYMNLLAQANAPEVLAADGFAVLWQFLQAHDPAPAWHTRQRRAQHEAVWAMGLAGGCNYYRASPLRPASAADAAASQIELPPSMLRVQVPTHILWGMNDAALLPGLLNGLDAYIPKLQITQEPQAGHWIIHEQPLVVQQWLSKLIAKNA
jgi:epoxide hydrolase 4